jgi:hypothetical protein
MKIHDGKELGKLLFNFREELFFFTSLIPFIVPIFEGKYSIPCNGNHKVCFIIYRMEKLFAP